MGDIDLLAVFLGAVAFFVIGAIWYGPLFGKAWQREVGLSDAQIKEGNVAVVFGLAFLFELLIAVMLGHNIARTSPAPHVIMMMAVGFGLVIMTPAIGIHYLFQRRSGKLFAIDAGYFVVGMAAMGGVFVAFA
ncbi:DUF1761 domain-containing protein [Novosphingobium marinum]|uniref:DUF1761 domain-containing protein n=1 Tax=Novosphingobium marinum TaxID=1514948 RepID=A0A7Y9XXD2_9SPHN|nr:DUF1761 domain-containing protein [Novosphingobium marinum]NYH96356.1 hypothetical protein [Novosphingobium marinum]